MGVEIRGKGPATSYLVPGNIIIASPPSAFRAALAFLEAGWKPGSRPMRAVSARCDPVEPANG